MHSLESLDTLSKSGHPELNAILQMCLMKEHNADFNLDSINNLQLNQTTNIRSSLILYFMTFTIIGLHQHLLPSVDD